MTRRNQRTRNTAPIVPRQPRVAADPPQHPSPLTPSAPGRWQVSALVTGGLLLVALGIGVAGWAGPTVGADGGSLPLIFLTGLLAGGLSCLAVQGGLLATAVTRHRPSSQGGLAALAGQVAPLSLFLAAKLVAYTLLGALLGGLGSVIGLTPVARGWLQIAAGLFMLGVVGQLLDLHPFFRYFSLQPPRWLGRRIGREARRDSLIAPGVLGAMTVFLPCGITQAMMVAAVGSGSAPRGALILFAFVLGTTPLFFALGYLATRLGTALQGVFHRVAAAVVAVLAVVAVWAGLALVGQPVLLGAADAPTVAGVVVATPGAGATGDPGGIQEAVIRAEPRAYTPNRVRFSVGQPAKLRVVTGERVGCTSVFTIPSLKIERAISRNDETVVDIPTDRPGKIKFTCGMGMYSGVIEVVP